MKQIIQSFKSGETILVDVPRPQVDKGSVLIKTSKTLVSLGTERMLVEFSQSNLISKARQQPDKVRQVYDKIRSDGLMPTIETVFRKLEEPIPLGYCNVGKVLEVGDNVSDIRIGDRVASNGPHAEYVCVPKNLVAKIPDEVSDEEACFTVIGAVGLQGVRLLKPNFGETYVVIGLGLIGLITVQLLIGNGCKVIGIDIDDTKLKLAEGMGVITFNPSKEGDPIRFVHNKTDNHGADGCIITASTKTNKVISESAKMARKRGKIILVGVVGLNLNRSDFYEKELSFQVSCSYGPGRYDAEYEQCGIDYPYAFVRWTERRNFQAILSAIASKTIDVTSLISQITDIEDYNEVYSSIKGSATLAPILDYSERDSSSSSLTIELKKNKFENCKGCIGIIGSGNYTKMTMLPLLKEGNSKIKYIASKGGLSGTLLAQKYGISNSTTDYHEILNDSEIDLVMITTRHHMHSKITCEALLAGKHVFVEKPLAISHTELDQLIEVYQSASKTITVGFNRRFSPHIKKMKALVGNAPMNIVMTMNVGSIDQKSWVHDTKIGGGRIIGEACHAVDLISHLVGDRVNEVCSNAHGVNPKTNSDNITIMLKYYNGSTGVINYFPNGSRAYSKERIELYSEGRTLVMDNFRLTTGYGFEKFKKVKTKLDKGHVAQFRELLNSLENESYPIIPFDEISNTTRCCLAAVDSFREGCWISVK